MGILLSRFWGSEHDPSLDVCDSATGLTPRQKAAVRDSWELVKQDIKGNGVALFIKFFKKHPEYQLMFTPFAHVPLEELASNKRLLAHATSVMYAITALVDNLDEPDCLIELLYKTAKSHVPRGLSVVHFNDLADVFVVMLEERLGAKITPFGKEAWVKAFQVMNSIIQKGLENQQQ